ncbi:MAG: histidinol-phosphate transaminase [Myxococcales bacterium]
MPYEAAHPVSRLPKPSLEMVCPYEPGKPIDEVRRELGLSHVIKLASNENPLGPSPKVLEALARTDLGLSLYPDYDGTALRADLASFHGIAPERITLGCGSAELMRTLADGYLEPGDEALVSDICFAVYENCIRIVGATPVVVPLTDDLHYDLTRMRKAVTPRTKAIFLASPNNPTGQLIPFEQLTWFARTLPSSVLIVLDLAYLDYIDASPYDALELAEELPNLVLLHTFSKAYGLAGLRIGYSISAPDVTRWLARVRTPFNTNTPGQLAARIALQDQDHLARTVELNRRMRNVLTEKLEALGLSVWPSHANFVLANVHRDPQAVFAALLHKGVIVRPVRHPRLSTCIRITTGTEAQIDELFAALPDALQEVDRG